MKKFTLFAAAALTLFSVSAHRNYFGANDVTGGIGFASYNPTTAKADEKTGAIVIIGANVHTATAEDGSIIYPTFLEAPDGTKGVEFDGKNYQKAKPSAVTYLRFRYDGNKNKIAELRQDKRYEYGKYDHFYLNLWIGPKPADATSDVITPQMVFTGRDKITADAAAPLYWVKFAPVTLTDEWQYVELEAGLDAVHTDSYMSVDDNWKKTKLRYVDIRFEDIQKGQKVAPKQFGAMSDWMVPVVKFDNMPAHNINLNDRNTTYNPVREGTTFIQAEDVDPYTLNNRKSHSDGCMGLSQWPKGDAARPYTFFYTEDDFDTFRIDNFENFTGMTLGSGWAPDGSTNNGDHKWALAGLSQTAPNTVGVSSYAGPYINDTDNTITMQDAMDNFGTWAEYTFYMEEDGYIDLSFRTAVHSQHLINTIQDQGKDDEHGYVTNYNKPREEGGYVVEGMDDDFLKLYGYSFAVTMDENPDNIEYLRSAYSSRPGHLTRVTDPLSHYGNPAKWIDTTEEVDGKTVNGIFTYIYPHNNIEGEGNLWRPYYKYNHFVDCYNAKDTDFEYDENGDIVMDENGNEAKIKVDSAWKKYCDKNGGLEQFLHPDYEDIPCSAGYHTIKVRFMGGVGLFDEMEVTAKKTPKYDAIEKVVIANNNEVEAAAAAEYFDLQGRKVANPQGGIYIVKRGSKVSKEVIR